MTAPATIPHGLAAATEHQPAVQAALGAALASGPSHAYSFIGPSGSGKRAAARAFAAELLAIGAGDPDDARRRALADPSPHPDLKWLRPPGNQHLVDDVKREIIGAISYRPFEGGRSVFVVEVADAMAEESQNALLKTLEEPPAYAHLILISSDPGALLETVLSRCQQVTFAALPREIVESRLAERLSLPPERVAALAALADGDLDRALLLGSDDGGRLRDLTERCCRAAMAGELAERPWKEVLDVATSIGETEGAVVEAAAAERAEEIGKGKDADRLRKEGAGAAKRVQRRARTAALDLSLALVAVWFTDLVAVAEGAPDLARNADRRAELEADAAGLDPIAARSIAERAMEDRRRQQVNVNEELALESLFHRAAAALGDS